MIKLIKLIYINLLSLLDYNKSEIAKANDIKSGYEYKPILLLILSGVYAYITYELINSLTLAVTDKTLILKMIFIINSILCLVIGVYNCKINFFSNKENEFLFSMPIEKSHIIISKLFNIYLKNILIITIFTASSLFAYNNAVSVDKTLLLISLVIIFITPIIPIIIASFLSFISNYIELKYSSIIRNLIKIFFLSILLLVVYIVFYSKDTSLDNTLNTIFTNISYIYPLNFLYNITIINSNLLTLLLLLLISIIILFLYTKNMSNNYIKYCSILSGISKNKNFTLKSCKKNNKLFGSMKKEFNCIFNNKLYLSSSTRFSLLFSIVIFVLLAVFDITPIKEYELFDAYFTVFAPTILSLVICINSSTISSISIEKDNIYNIKSFPINFKTVLLSKFLVGFILNLVFILFNFIIVLLFIKPSTFALYACLFFPIVAALFSNTLYLTLDYKFPYRDDNDDHKILNNRLVSFVPALTGICIGFLPLFFPIVRQYRIVLITHGVFIFILLIVCLIYLLINHKKMYNSL